MLCHPGPLRELALVFSCSLCERSFYDRESMELHVQSQQVEQQEIVDGHAGTRQGVPRRQHTYSDTNLRHLYGWDSVHGRLADRVCCNHECEQGQSVIITTVARGTGFGPGRVYGSP